jgi:DNA-binding beta-propeller fold protein YncE
MVRRRLAWSLLAGSLLLAACGSMLDLAALRPAPAGAASAAPGGTLDLWRSFSGGRLVANPTAPPQAPVPLRVNNYLDFVAPSAVAARGPDLFIVDSGLNVVFRYDAIVETMTAIPGLPALPGTKLYVMADSSLLILDPPNRRVLHVTRDGVPINVYSDDVNLVRPVGMAVDEERGIVLVADSFRRDIVAFHLGGGASTLIVPMTQQGTRALSVSGIAMTPQGMFVLDRLGHQVLQLDRQGLPIDLFGSDVLRLPTMMAVDPTGRVVVIDAETGSLDVFVGGQFANAPRSASSALGDWRDVKDVSFDDHGSLYVADQGSARVDVLRFRPSPGAKGGD